MKGKVKSTATVKRHLRELRKEIDASGDVVFRGIACAIETAVRWAIEPVVDWPGLVKQAKDDAEILKEELRQ